MQLHLDHRFSFRSCDGVVVMDPGRDGERVAEMGRALLPGTTWHATRLMSWIPHLRQFQVRQPAAVKQTFAGGNAGTSHPFRRTSFWPS